MLPRLYEEFSTSEPDFNEKYLGTLNTCLSCKVTEVRNGEYTLSLTTTVNDNCASVLLSQRIIGIKPNPFDDIQFFEIVKTTRTLDGKIQVDAKHVKSFADNICSEGDTQYEGFIVPVTGTPKELWDLLMEEYITTTTPFSFTSDITSQKDFYLGFSVAETLGNILGGKEGSFIDTFGGEFHYDNYSINFLQHRGTFKNYKIRYGKNISSCSQSESSETCYSHVLPMGKVSNGNRKMNFFAQQVEIPDNLCQYTKVYLLDCTDFLDQFTVGEHGERYEEVREAMQEYALQFAQVNDLGKPNISISVNLRAELDEMSNIGLCDTVEVILDNFGTKATAKITKVVYDALLERWDTLEIGTPTITVADLILNKKKVYIHQ